VLRPRVAARSPLSGASLLELGLPLGGPPASGGRSSTTVRVPVASCAAGVPAWDVGGRYVSPTGALIATFRCAALARRGAFADARRVVASGAMTGIRN